MVVWGLDLLAYANNNSRRFAVLTATAGTRTLESMKHREYKYVRDRVAVSVAEAAEMAGVSTKTIIRAFGRGDLRSAKVGNRRLIRPDDLAAWIERSMVEVQ